MKKKYYFKLRKMNALIRVQWEKVKSTSLSFETREEALLFTQQVAIVADAEVQLSEVKDFKSVLVTYTP